MRVEAINGSLIKSVAYQTLDHGPKAVEVTSFFGGGIFFMAHEPLAGVISWAVTTAAIGSNWAIHKFVIK